MLPTTPLTKPYRPIRTLLSFVLLTFGLSWGLWFALWTWLVTPPLALVTLGAWAPTAAALFVTARTEGRAGVRVLLGHVLRWRVDPVWYVVAALGPLGVALVAVLLAGLLSAPLPSLVETAARFGLGAERAPLLFALLPVIFVVTFVSGGPVAEELGWRGFAQTRLQRWLTPTAAGLVVVGCGRSGTCRCSWSLRQRLRGCRWSPICPSSRRWVGCSAGSTRAQGRACCSRCCCTPGSTWCWARSVWSEPRHSWGIGALAVGSRRGGGVARVPSTEGRRVC